MNGANNPTFVRSNQQATSIGYYTRTLFVWSPFDTWDNLAGTSWTSTLNYDGISTSLIASKPEFCHGTNVLPAGYWHVGKQIRATGTVYVSGSSGQLFNMRFGLYTDSSTTYTWLAKENTGANHYFFGNSKGDALVDFECMLVLRDSGPTMIGQGYYQYNRNSNLVANTNRSNSYVPLWNSTYEAVGDLDNSSTNILFSFYGSTVDTIRLQNLRLEELA